MAPSEVARLLLTFLCWHGRLGISDPTSFGVQYASSRRITTSLRAKIMEQAMHIGDALASVRTTKSQVQSETREALKVAADAFRVNHDDRALAISLATGRWQLALRRRRVPPVGLRAAPSHTMALPFRRRSFGMGCASDMAGFRLGCPVPACVRSPSPSHTLCHAHFAGFPQSATMRSVTSWLAR